MNHKSFLNVLLVLCLLITSGGVLFAQKEEAKKKGKEEAAEKKAPKPKWVAIEGGTIFPVSGPVIKEGTILIKDGKIAALGSGLKAPEGATVVDARGKFVCPGFVAVTSRGILGVRRGSSKERAKDGFDPFSDTMLMGLAAGITTAHEGIGGRSNLARLMGISSSMFRGVPQGVLGGVIGKLSYGSVEGFGLREPAGVYMAVGTRASQRETASKALQKAIDYIEKREQWIADVVAGKKEAKEPKADDLTKALAQCREGKQALYFSASKQEEIQVALELIDEFKFPMIFAGAQEAWTMPAEIGRRPVSVLLCPRGGGGRSLRPYRTPYRDVDHGWSLLNPLKMSEAGIPWACSTLGSGVMTSLFAGRDVTSLVHEAAFAVRGGVTNEEALYSITLGAARILKVDDRVGSLEVGKDADVLVMDREPLDYRSFVDLALVNGKLVYDRKKVALWSHVPTDRSQHPQGWAPWGPWPTLEKADEGPGSGQR